MRQSSKGPLPKRIANFALLRRAKNDDLEALEEIFRNFLSKDETIVAKAYLGLRGFWQVGSHSFVCVTESKICRIEVGWLLSIDYREAYLEDCNAVIMYQPGFFYINIFAIIFVLSTFGLGVILLPFYYRIYFAVIKSGADVFIRSSSIINIFCDITKLPRLANIIQYFGEQRDKRISIAFN